MFQKRQPAGSKRRGVRFNRAPWVAVLRAHWPILPIVALALYLRVGGLFPTFFYGDAAEYGGIAKNLAGHPFYLAYPDIEHFGPRPFVSQPPLILYLMAIVGSLVGDLEAGAVLVSVILGTATVGVVYALTHRLGGSTAAVAAALLLATLPFHVKMSRRAYLDAGLVFFMTLAIFCYVMWSTRRTRGWALATGFAAGGAVLSKLPGVLILAPLAAALVVELAIAIVRERAEVKRVLANAGLALAPIAGLLLLYFALVWHLNSTVELFTKLAWQFGRVASDGTQPVEIGAVERPWHWYFTDASYSLPSQLTWMLAILAVLGLAYALGRLAWSPIRNRALVAVVLFPLVVIAFFTLSARKEWFYVLPVAPGAAILGGLAAGAAASAFGEAPFLHPRWWRRGAAAGALFGAFALAALPTYAGVVTSVDHMTGVDRVFGSGTKEAAFFIHERDPDAAQVGTLLGRYGLYYYNGQPAYHWYVDHAFVEQGIRSGHVRFVVLDNYLGIAEEDGWMQHLVDTYGGVEVATFGDDWGVVKVFELHP